jgi:hypothetical protein
MSESGETPPGESKDCAALQERLLALQGELLEWKSNWQLADARITRQENREVILGTCIRELEAENLQLRKIAAHVPAREYIKAKEAAGFAVKVHAKDADTKHSPNGGAVRP